MNSRTIIQHLGSLCRLLTILCAVCIPCHMLLSQESDRVALQFGKLFRQYAKNRLLSSKNQKYINVSRLMPYDVVLENTSLEGWSYLEKRELALLLMVSTSLDAAGGDCFKYMLGKDAKRIGHDLGKMKPDELRHLLNSDHERIRSYYAVAEYLMKPD
jgi:hypothetical protein